MDDDCQVLVDDNDRNVQVNEDDDPLIAEVGNAIFLSEKEKFIFLD
jgi:hypothetical protein